MPILDRRSSKEKPKAFKMVAGHESLLPHTEVDRESLVARTESIGLPSPRLWAGLGCVYVALGLSLIVLAGSWFWWLGVVLGFGVVKMGTTFIGIGLTGGHQSPLPAGASFGQRCKHTASSAVMWGSSKFQRLFWVLRWPLYIYGLFALLLIVIHVASPDPRIQAFPAKCSRGQWLGCSRVAETASHAARNLKPLHLAAALNDTQAAAVAWIGEQAGARVLYSSPGFVHARFVTLVFGFADDFVVGIRCDGDNKTVVEAQGQLRIGQSDLGVNARRNQRFFAAMQAAAMPPGRWSS